MPRGPSWRPAYRRAKRRNPRGPELMSNALSFATFTETAKAVPLAAAFIFGSGMSGLAERCGTVCRLPFGEVPGLSATSVTGHSGYVTLGDWAGKRVLLFEGRLHYYEGHSWQSVTQPIQVAHSLGTRTIVLTNAAGGIHDALGPGSLMAVHDHIEWTWPYCWRRPGPGGTGPARPSPYSSRLLQLMPKAAEQLGIELHAGIYGAVTGPCYETKAEIRALKNWGAD